MMKHTIKAVKIAPPVLNVRYLKMFRNEYCDDRG